jgi:hypothetical protein
MHVSQAEDRSDALPAPGEFSLAALFLALVVGPLVGLIWGWAADAAQFYVSPFLLFPLLVGVFTGLTIVGLARFAQAGHRPTIWLAVVLAAGTAACGQHYLHYWTLYSQALPEWSIAPGADDGARALGEAIAREATAGNDAIRKQLAPSFGRYMLAQAQRGRPLPGGFLAVGWVAWLTWSIDLILTAAAAIAVTVPAVRIPYCNRCRTWYRTIRNGRIDVDTARRLAEICHADGTPQFHSPRYRLSCCQGGCSATRCELSWEEPNGPVNLVCVWLDSQQRNQAAAVLNRLAEERDE